MPPAMPSTPPQLWIWPSFLSEGPFQQRPVKQDYIEPVILTLWRENNKGCFPPPESVFLFILQGLANFTQFPFLSSPGPLHTGQPPHYQLRGDGRDPGVRGFRKLIPLPHPTEGFRAQSRWSRERSRPGTPSQRPEGTSEGHSD